MSHETPEVEGYSPISVFISALVGIVVAVLSVWWASGFGPFYETLFRVGPTVEGGGVGADWVAGNTIPALDFLIALVHAADVILGVFILLLVFLHWASFRRLAARMRHPGEDETGETVMADGSGDGGER
ncbi:hypothetical protein HWV23_09450 [Natronomonas halophila]|uniref:hypothetical protein n=1 Tax=Natronomonas halophila TaxID=2747817 RepID=UPI0015B74893|nr:hypothetical protein [Natronomonas halophila]QLD85939.1 hypothetical protein HWV23_09450 [Natronomonas halophila]